MTPLTLENYLIVGAILFVMGMIGFLTRRNVIIMFLSAEMMLQGVAVNLLAFSRFRGNLGGHARFGQQESDDFLGHFQSFVVAISTLDRTFQLLTEGSHHL